MLKTGRKAMGAVFIGLLLCGLFSVAVNCADARTTKGRTADELNNPYDWEKERNSSETPTVPAMAHTPMPSNGMPAAQSGDQQKKDFYDRYFRKGEETRGTDIPVTEEERKARLKALLPNFTPTPAGDAKKMEIKQLVQELAEEPHRRNTAVERLAAIGKPALPALREALHDNYHLKRMGALCAIGYIFSPDVIPDVQAKLNDTAPLVRAEAVKTLGKFKHRPSVSALLALLDDPDKNVRRTVIFALARIKGSAARDAMISALGNSNPEIRKTAAEEISVFDDEAVVQALLQSTEDDAREVRIAAIRSLGEIGDPEAGATLKKLAHHEDRMIRQEALQALENLD